MFFVDTSDIGGVGFFTHTLYLRPLVYKSKPFFIRLDPVGINLAMLYRDE